MSERTWWKVKLLGGPFDGISIPWDGEAFPKIFLGDGADIVYLRDAIGTPPMLVYRYRAQNPSEDA